MGRRSRASYGQTVPPNGGRTITTGFTGAKGAIRLRQRSSPVRPALAARLRATARVWLLTGLILAAFGAMYFRVAEKDISGALLLVVPAVLWVAAFRGYTKTRDRREPLEFLYESMLGIQRGDGVRGAAHELL